MQPSIWFLVGTLVFTSAATAMLCGAIMTDHWEQVNWDRGKLEDIAVRQKNATQVRWLLEWLLDGQVGRIVYTNEEGLRKIPIRKKPVKNVGNSVTASNEETDEEVAVFLIPMHGGIWTLCVTLSGKCCHYNFRLPHCITSVVDTATVKKWTRVLQDTPFPVLYLKPHGNYMYHPL
jgi:hypothetical protein